MANINATTPQLQVFKSVVEAYMTRDLSNVAPYLSKDFKFQTFPKIADLPDLAKAEHVEKYGAIYRSFSKVDADFHEVIDAPGKVVAHVTGKFTVEGTILDYDTLLIVSFVEEDGRLKLLSMNDFADPHKRDTLHTSVAAALAKGVL